MIISTVAFKNGEAIPKQFTCDGDDHNPPLQIEEVPKGTKSLVLIVDDPDSPSGLWVHWLLWNIDPKTKIIAEKSLPKGAVEGRTSFGKQKWGGPCPGSGEHRYFFKIYALDCDFNLPPEADKETLEEAMVGHVLDHAELMGVYER